jgi:hypothetical protein
MEKDDVVILGCLFLGILFALDLILGRDTSSIIKFSRAILSNYQNAVQGLGGAGIR